MALLGDLCNLKALPMMFTPSRAPAGMSKLVGEQSLTEGCKVGSTCHRALPLLKAGSKAGATQARGSAEESQGLHWSHPFMEQETKVALRGAPHIKHFLLCPGRGVRLWDRGRRGTLLPLQGQLLCQPPPLSLGLPALRKCGWPSVLLALL